MGDIAHWYSVHGWHCTLQLNCDRTATTHRSHPPRSPSWHSTVLLPADAGSKARATKSWQLVLTGRRTTTTFSHRMHACSHDRRPSVPLRTLPGAAERSNSMVEPSVQKKTKSLLVFLPCPVLQSAHDMSSERQTRRIWGFLATLNQILIVSRAEDQALMEFVTQTQTSLELQLERRSKTCFPDQELVGICKEQGLRSSLDLKTTISRYHTSSFFF